jgi:hypothetical protein
MGIRHTFESGRSDGADPTLLQPSYWNDDHTGGLEEIFTATGDIIYMGAYGADYAFAGTGYSPWGSNPSYPLDGNDNTYWQGSENTDIWWRVDLGVARTIAGFRAIFSNVDKNWLLQSSDNDSSWTTRYTYITGGSYPDTGQVGLVGGPYTHRYWKWNPQSVPNGNFWRINSVWLYGVASPLRLPIGSEGQVLKVRSGVPVWE